MDGDDDRNPRDQTLGRLAIGDEHFRVVSVPLPDLVSFDEVLTAAERDICRRVLAGASDSQIADQRQTSSSTVSNQLRRVYEKLDVSGRSALIAALSDDADAS